MARIIIITLSLFHLNECHDVYDKRYLKKLLKDKYKSHIFFSCAVKGVDTLICFIDMANYIINKKFKEKENDIENESKRIIKAAANLIKAENREKDYRTDVYPTSQEIMNGFQKV